MSATIVDLFEEVLEVPFEDRFISNLDAPILRKLAFRVRDFYTQYELPPKNENELRPYLFPRFTTVTKIGSDYYSHPGHLKHGTYDFDPAAVGDVTSEVKKYLLYCHSLCIHDALPGLLDYFLEDNPYAQSRIPAVTHLLRQYAQLGSLLRYRVLIPVADEVTGFGDKEHVPVDEHEEAEVLVQFRNANIDLSDIEEEVRLANQVGVDLVRAMVRHIASTVKEQ